MKPKHMTIADTTRRPDSAPGAMGGAWAVRCSFPGCGWEKYGAWRRSAGEGEGEEAGLRTAHALGTEHERQKNS